MQDHATLRCAELTLAQGFDTYIVKSYTVGDATAGESHSVDTDDPTMALASSMAQVNPHPEITDTIEMFHGYSGGSDAIDARITYKSIAAKHGITTPPPA